MSLGITFLIFIIVSLSFELKDAKVKMKKQAKRIEQLTSKCNVLEKDIGSSLSVSASSRSISERRLFSKNVSPLSRLSDTSPVEKKYIDFNGYVNDEQTVDTFEKIKKEWADEELRALEIKEKLESMKSSSASRLKINNNY